MLKIAKLDRYDMVNSPLGDKPAFTIWFSGCSRRCKGCQNPELWDGKLGTEFEVHDLVQLIDHERNSLGFKDVVFLGGEPLEQNDKDFMMLCEELYIHGYKIWLYTGYDFDDIHQSIKQYIYTMKCGEYREELREEGKFPITSNQEVFRNFAGDWKQIDLDI